MSAARAPIKLAAPLSCPSCGHKVTCHWIEGHETAEQQCRSCGRVFEASWPGFTFEPETVIVHAGDAAGHREAGP